MKYHQYSGTLVYFMTSLVLLQMSVTLVSGNLSLNLTQSSVHTARQLGSTDTDITLLPKDMHWEVGIVIGIDTNIEVIVVSLTTWEAHHSPRAKPEGCGELPMSLMRQQWPQLRYQFLFYHDETKLIMNKQILSIQMLKSVPKLSLVTAWLHVHILGSCDLIVSPW